MLKGSIASVGAPIQQSCHMWHWCDIFAKVGPKSLGGYSNSLLTENIEIKIWGPHEGKCTMIGKNSRTKSGKMRPEKIEQAVDLQRWFNDSRINQWLINLFFTTVAMPFAQTASDTASATFHRGYNDVQGNQDNRNINIRSTSILPLKQTHHQDHLCKISSKILLAQQSKNIWLRW